MSYTVLHMQKLKQSAIKGMQIHNQREKESQTNPDIDASKVSLNYDLVNEQSIDYTKKIDARIKEGLKTGKAVRKDAVKVASFLVTSDKAFFDNMSERAEKKFFETAYDYFCKEYGKENIAYAMVHKDEKTPHMHVGFVPITEDGRLSAKDFFGKKQQLVKLQDTFHQHMLEAGFDLERGVSSDRVHIETQRLKAMTVKETVQELEAELKEKHLQQRVLEESIRKTEDRLSNLTESLSGVKKVDEIIVKEKGGLIRSRTVEIGQEDFEDIKRLAKASEAVKEENEGLKRENNRLLLSTQTLKKEKDTLFQENQQLRTENKLLDKENKFLTRTLNRVTSQFREQIKNLDMYVGYFKAELLTKMNMSLLKKYFSGEKELKGAQNFFSQDEKQKENQKGKKDRGYER
ncbi:Plasmid recombination enzyme [Bacillus sp. OV322]|uniref:MobV family relaxase n=1 Tax=Bacillus sp. OV322 TaxID=1882764 RepID=UPI0008ED5DFD|nr:MobV family relaxase [Bacillus sp. OV322]SFD03957.1 Plasmid recombination enzyme [Bacillus sp. OV322]